MMAEDFFVFRNTHQFREIDRGSEASDPGLGDQILYSSGSEFYENEEDIPKQYLDLKEEEILQGEGLSDEADNEAYGHNPQAVDTLDADEDISNMIEAELGADDFLNSNEGRIGNTNFPALDANNFNSGSYPKGKGG
jgi:hypothetical protein